MSVILPVLQTHLSLHLRESEVLRNKKITTYDRNGEYSQFIPKYMKFGVHGDFDYVFKLCRGNIVWKLDTTK